MTEISYEDKGRSENQYKFIPFLSINAFDRIFHSSKSLHAEDTESLFSPDKFRAEPASS
jgi:hypothetical protein